MKRGRKNRPEMLGDAPVDLSKTRDLLRSVAEGLDKVFNGDLKGRNRKNGFVLLTYQFDDIGDIENRCNYVSNGAERKEIVVLLKEMIRRFEGAPEVSGRA